MGEAVMNCSGLVSPKAAVRIVLFALAAAFATASPSLLAQCGPLDVVFVVDTTGSMGGAIENVKAELPAIIAQIESASGGDFRLGLVEFKDDVVVRNDLAAGNSESVRNNILGLSASGGSGEPEASDEALKTVIQGLAASARPAGRQTGDFGTFRPEAGKIVILITDARPAGFDDEYTVGEDDVAAANLAQEAATRGILISAVFVPTPAAEAFGVLDTVELLMTNYATVSGGIYIRTESDGSGTADAISEIILNCGGLRQGFVLIVNPRSAAIGNDGAATFEVQTFRSREFDSDIVLSIADLPEGMTATFTPPVIAAPGTGTSILRLVPGS
ncbi:MAG TPA: vWA domain-containing protein, partial [Thermoanaerobaculia bacterium]|nr:vWA domain-containing protein [Thermoanaerobaculia bacterium]